MAGRVTLTKRREEHLSAIRTAASDMHKTLGIAPVRELAERIRGHTAEVVKLTETLARGGSE